MKQFQNTLKKEFYFSTCEICDAACCKGSNGTIFSQLLLEDFKEVYENFPIVFVLGDLNYLKPVVLLTNGLDACRYLSKKNLCSIYEKRPSVCKLYPLSPHLTNIPFIDLSCPAVGQNGDLMVKDAVLESRYSNIVFDNYEDKYIKMHFHFDKFNKKENLEFFGKIRGNEFFKFKEDFNDEFIKLHLSSLKNFDEYFRI